MFVKCLRDLQPIFSFLQACLGGSHSLVDVLTRLVRIGGEFEEGLTLCTHGVSSS